MSLDLHAALPVILPKALLWAQELSAQAEQEGLPLGPDLSALARRVGVQNPERIRVLEQDYLPKPEDADLQQAVFATGLLGASMTALTVGYGIVVGRGCGTPELLSHNFRHVYQFEQAGSLESFLTDYICQVIEFGHDQAPLERDARQHERRWV